MKEVKGVGGVGGGKVRSGEGISSKHTGNSEISLQLDVTVLGKRSGLTE